MTAPRYISITAVANLVRDKLRAEFPGVKFSVRSQKYSMGCHLDVRWTDGPPQALVRTVTDFYSGTSFDGLDDSTHHHTREFNGVQVRFAGSFPSCQRELSESPARKASIEALLRARLAIDANDRFGTWSVDELVRQLQDAADYRREDWLEYAFRVAVLRQEP